MESGTLSVAGSQKQDLSWLITDFTDRVTDVAHALVVSPDGVPVAVSEGIGPAQARQLSAITSGLVSLGTAAARVCQCGSVTQTRVAMGQGTLVIMSISDGSSLATLATTEADLDLIAYQMTMLVEAAGAVLAPGVR
jgi:predicted regulator of Ras-like GTPase activity (Roadblock/LC7/MglB family)